MTYINGRFNLVQVFLVNNQMENQLIDCHIKKKSQMVSQFPV
jgi:hypothetical protein